MKKNLRAIAAAILSLAALAACDKERTVDSVITPDRTKLLNIAAQDPAAEAIILNTNTSWMVLDVPSWLNVSPTTGYGNGIITVTPAANFRNEDTATEARSGSFRIVGNANSVAHPTGISITITVSQLGFTPVVDPSAGIGGIPSLEEFLKFAETVASGGGTSRWQNADGAVELQTDIDLSSVDKWTPIGMAKLGSSVKAEPSIDSWFTGVFDGMGHTISGINWEFDPAGFTSCSAFGLFGAAQNAEIRNLVLGKEGDKIVVCGTPSGPIAAAALLAVGNNVSVKNVTNNVDVVFNASADPQSALAGIVAKGDACNIGGSDPADAVVNNGDVVALSVISLTEAGESGHMFAGIQGYMHYGSIAGSANYGTVSCASGRSGGIVASINSGVTAENFASVSKCVNYGTIRRDLYGNAAVTGNQKRMGGIFGGAEGWFNIVEDCVNEGCVFAEYLCRCGGCCGHSKIQVAGFENKGIILSDKDSSHGPGWISGYFDSVANAAKSGVLNIAHCKMGGKVGSWTEFKDNPEGAPAASMDNVLGYNNKPDTQFNSSEIIQQ